MCLASGLTLLPPEGFLTFWFFRLIALCFAKTGMGWPTMFVKSQRPNFFNANLDFIHKPKLAKVVLEKQIKFVREDCKEGVKGFRNDTLRLEVFLSL